MMTDQQHFSRFIELLRLESRAIATVADRLRFEDVSKAVDILVQCAGKVVVTGVGKSGLIAQKVAATMTSTGTTAVFLHPSDGLHGGLGLVSAGDVVLVLSNSGESDEILALLPAISQRGARVIAIVGNLASRLARRADAVLNAQVDEEACPLNLAPTASTTVALAIGDALAVALMQVKGWSETDFAQNHPGGRLGKRLTLRVADLMHAGAENPTVGLESSWSEVVRAITTGGLGAVSVVDVEGKLAGLITDGDLRRAIGRTEPSQFVALDSVAIMTADPIVVSAELLAYDALTLMENRSSQISVLPVVDAEMRSIGIIRLHDIVRAGL